MLLHLHESAAADALSNSATARGSHASIENLLLAHFDGNHVISLRPEDAEALLGSAHGWSPRARRALQHVDENFAQIAGLRDEVPWSIELGIGAAFDGTAREVPGGRRVIRAPLSAFDRTHKTACCVLLGENRIDAGLFAELGIMMLAQRRWEAIDMVHEPRGGGGDTIASEFGSLADQGRIVLAIGDTDQRHPGGAVGGTYRKLAEAAKDRPTYQRARPLHVRTAEALVPLAIYREVLSSPERLTRIDRIAQLLRSAPADVLRYAHLKDGLRLHQVDNPRTPEEGKYWRPIAKNCGRDRCNQASCEQCTKREECKCYVVDALGADALSAVVSWMQARKSKRDLAKRFRLLEDEDAALKELADEVLAFGLALAPLST
ncbi:hypothetical protein WME98_26705 [Sorangium sp. So ce296]|uniref:hypothetical protein n=1 Tax=Sorangium sp. So ce296 TaxID=3133296 RepID=UPI003F5E975E